jgi:hypothetical protein
MQLSPATVLGLFALVASAGAADRTFVVTVEAGEFDRRGTVVEFTLPEALRNGRPVLRFGGKAGHIQVDQNGRAAFVCEELKKGTSANYELGAGLPPEFVQTVSARRDEFAGTNKVGFRVLQWPPPRHMRGNLVMAYQAEPGGFPRNDIKPAFRRGGYLHPIYTPSGKLVTDDFPPNHVHHHGVWWAWTNTEFDGRKPDFWNVGDGKGRVEFVALDGTWTGEVHGGLRARHRFVDLTSPEPVTALEEMWEVRMYASPDAQATYWIFDLVSEQQCATTNALKLPEYRYGGIGVRGNWAWNGKENAMFLTSEGETNRDKGNTARGRWCDMGGMVDGKRVGIAILCHPDNFRAPQPMRIHPTEPFFNFAPQQAGDMAIKPGDKFVSRYRFVVHDGPPDKAELDRLWYDYAHPPLVKVEAK